jgi:hypothetical protein
LFQYARQQVGLAESRSPAAANEETEESADVDLPADDDEKAAPTDDQVIDLDTRLKMLMKDKSGAMPAFLLQELNSGSDDSDKVEILFDFFSSARWQF